MSLAGFRIVLISGMVLVLFLPVFVGLKFGSQGYMQEATPAFCVASCTLVLLVVVLWAYHHYSVEFTRALASELSRTARVGHSIPLLAYSHCVMVL